METARQTDREGAREIRRRKEGNTRAVMLHLSNLDAKLDVRLVKMQWLGGQGWKRRQAR